MKNEKEKMEIRTRRRTKRQNLRPEQIYTKSCEIQKKLYELEEYKNAKNILFYLSYGSEVMTYDAISMALLSEKRVFAPYLVGKDMDFSELNDLSEMKKSDYGFLEPVSRRSFPKEDIDLIIIPGVGFDEEGNRIGSGLGYYDRFLPGTNAKTIAIAYDIQMVDKVPVHEKDIPVDMVITESRVIRCTK